MNLLYIGQVVPNEKIGGCTGYSASGDLMQKNILMGLNEYKDLNISVISVYPKSSWPHDRVVVKGDEDYICEKLKVKNVTYINIPILKQFLQEKQLIKAGREIAKNTTIDAIMVFNMYPQFGGAALKLSKKLGKPLVGILADFPNDYNKFWGGKDHLFVRIINAITWKNIRELKYGIVLNKNAEKYMDFHNKTIVIPGGVDNQADNQFLYHSVKNHNVVYAGALTEYSGVLSLIDAINTIEKKDICLNIYGDGPLKDKIREMTNEKIKYMGKVSIDEMRKIQRKSWVLVNPRSTKEFVSSVTFPSKIFEYIMCCRPVVSTEFDGLQDDIKALVWGCKDGSPDMIAEVLLAIYNLSEEELKDRVEKSFSYIVSEYCWIKNANKIYEFLMGSVYDK